MTKAKEWFEKSRKEKTTKETKSRKTQPKAK
jgi:hypothetical protein